MKLRLSNRSEEVSRRGYKSDQATMTPVLLTCKSCPAVKDIFTAKSAKKSDFKNFAFFASSRWIFWIAAGLRCENTLSVAVRGI